MTSSNAQTDTCTCPRCGTVGTKGLIADAGYHCTRCAFELAHLELGVNGSVRRVVGWLRSPGDVLGDRYLVTTALGKGGFAAVYLVEDQKLRGKRRAIKEVPEHLYDDQETTLLSRLRHRGVPDIVDRFEADGMVYLVLEFGGSRTLESERRASGGRIPLARFRPWMMQLCDVLEYLHGQTPPIVHRDLKPSNVLLDEHERVMLIDFGIAKESEGLEATRTLARAVSHSFSPLEQIMGTGTDARSDIYALGATMYVLLTGTLPPPAQERLAGREVTPPRQLDPAIPAPLESVILRALELQPGRRPASVRAIRDGIEGRTSADDDALTVPLDVVATGDADTTVPVARPAVATPASAPLGAPRARRSWMAAAAVAAAALATVGVWLGLGRTRTSETPRPFPPTTLAVVAPPSTARSPAPPPPDTAVAMPPSTAGVTPTTLLIDAGTRIKDALAARDLGRVTVEVGEGRVLLGNLRDDDEARRAREVVAALPELDLDIDTSVTPPPEPSKARSEAPAARPAAKERPVPQKPSRSSARRRAASGKAARPTEPQNWTLIPKPATRTE
jgi:tRNA A-37 threonylcarbamoyl transferase component Bud32